MKASPRAGLADSKRVLADLPDREAAAARPAPGTRRGDLLVVACTAALGMCMLYGPQPLLPSLRAEFGVDQAAVSLLITAAMLPLGLAPVAYGCLLETFSAKRLLAASAAVLCACQLALSAQHQFPFLLGLRVVQGLAFPALFTSLMTYVAGNNPPDAMARVMSLYIGATVCGGFGGRILAGLLSSLWGWRAALLAFGLALTALLPPLLRLRPDTRAAAPSRLRLEAMREMLRIPGVKPLYLMVSCLFFVFTAVFNLLPFRMTDLAGDVSDFRIGLMYAGQVTGILVSFTTPRLVAVLGPPPGLFRTGLVLFLVAVLGFLLPSTAATFGDIFLLTAAMFLVHATAPGYLNQTHRTRAGVVNGMYLMAYYLGGVLGSFLPVLVYRRWGWEPCILLLAAVAITGLAAAERLQRRRPDGEGRR